MAKPSTQRGGHDESDPRESAPLLATAGSDSGARGADERAGHRIDVAGLRAFLKRALEDDAVADAVNELLFEYVVVGHLHRSAREVGGEV